MTDDEFWRRIFPPADASRVAAGVRAARDRHDARILELLDRQLDDPSCSITACSERAVAAVFCKQTGRLLRLTCAIHREQLRALARESAHCRVCHTSGAGNDLFRWVGIFTSRSQA